MLIGIGKYDCLLDKEQSAKSGWEEEFGGGGGGSEEKVRA
jgi:hypothetical protein